MCRLCSLYNKIDLGTLPTSNPWLDDEEEYTAPPTTILVESPESARYTAWSNVRRFPSLLPLTNSDTESVSSTDSFNAHGPVELTKEYRGVTSSTRPSRVASWQPTPVMGKPMPPIHELTRRKRVDSFAAVVRQERHYASMTATPESTSPTSEHGFEFGFGQMAELPAHSVDVPQQRKPRKLSVASQQHHYQAFNPSSISLVPAPLRVRSGSESPSDYINGLCQNW